MKAILLSIKPQYCELIVSGQKKIEVRKSEPKLNTPFKCYVYCTKAKRADEDYMYIIEGNEYGQLLYCGGKVIGEFICDRIITVTPGNYVRLLPTKLTAVFPHDLINYAGLKTIYGWHISDLKIYDKPKELSEFRKAGGRQCVSDNGICCRYIQASPGDDPADANTMSCIYGEQNCPFEYLNHPPQSWCYVEERRKINANL